MRLQPISVLTVLAIVNAAAEAGPQCADWTQGPMLNQSEGLNEVSFASAVWDPPGTMGPVLVVGGTFTSAGGAAANNVAMWDGAAWHALGDGLNGGCFGLAVYNGDLVACGQFSSAGGVPASNIARFDGEQWHALGAGLGNPGQPDSATQGMGVYNGELVVGGFFTTAGGSSASHIAKWNGSSWSTLGSGLNDSAGAFKVFNGNLIVGGSFTTAGGATANHVASWNGSSWSAIGNGIVTGGVAGIEIFNGELLVCGGFNSGVARWNGSAWVGMPPLNNAVSCMAVYNGQLIVGGTFTNAAGAGDHIAFWTGSGWQSLGGVSGGGAINGPAVWALTVYNSTLHVGGTFDTVGGSLAAHHIAQWNGASWSALDVAEPWVFALTPFTSHMAVAGNFVQPTSYALPANHIIRWNGAQTIPMGAGMNNAVNALKGFKYPGPFGDYELIAGGWFSSAGGVAANFIARWNEDPLQGFPPPAWEAMGSGFNNAVMAIERYNDPGGAASDETYAAGAFTASGATGLNRIARWNESNDTWLPLGTGMNNTVYALKVYDGQLYAGGAFTTAGGVGSGGLARWNGSAWTNVGGFFNGTVYALEVHNGELVMAGLFPGLPGGPNIAKYSSVSGYSNVGTGGTNATVRALKSVSGNLYVGGEFTSAGGVAAQRVAVWNGSTWAEVQGGADSTVYGMASYNNEVHAGGLFNAVDNGSTASPAWARYLITGAPWIVAQNFSQSVSCKGDVTFYVTPADGYDKLAYEWKRDGVTLADGATASGSTISGATTQAITISNVAHQDEGEFTCIVSNPCGDATSFPASLTVLGCRDCPDLTGDDIVNVSDLLIVISSWGPCPAPPASCNADVAPNGGDGVVNVQDLLKVIAEWGTCQ